MRTQHRQLTYYVAATIDGCIAGPAGEFDFFGIDPEVVSAMNAIRPETVPTAMREQYGIADDAPNLCYDTVLMGRATYEIGLPYGMTSPYSHMRQVVFSSTLDPGIAGDDKTLEVVGADPLEFVRELKQDEGKGIWLCGGGRLASALLPEIDEIVVKRYPVVAGQGIRMFDGPFQPTRHRLVESREFDCGALVQTYRKE
jgi:dihydrofolate reductase